MKISHVPWILIVFFLLLEARASSGILEDNLDQARLLRHKDPRQAIQLLEDNQKAFDPAQPRLTLNSQFELFNLLLKIGEIQKAQETLAASKKLLGAVQELQPWLAIMDTEMILSRRMHNAARTALQNLWNDIEHEKDPKLRLWLNSMKAAVYVQENQYDKALDILNKILPTATEARDTSVQLAIYDQLLVIFFYMGDYDKAIELCNKVIEMAKDLGDSFAEVKAISVKMKSFHSKSVVQQDLIAEAKTEEIRNIETKKSEEYQKLAREAEDQTLTMSRSIGDYRTLVNALIMQQTRNIVADNDEEALRIAEETLKIAKSHQLLYEEGVTYNNIGIAYRGAKDHNKGIQALKKAEAIFKELDIEQSVVWILEDYSISYRWNKEFEKSLDYFQQYHRAVLALLAKTNNQKVLELQEQFESDKKQREFETLSQQHALVASELKTQKTQSIMFIGFVLLLILIAVLQFNRNKVINYKNQKLELKEAQILEKTRDLHSILDNIHQGVLTITMDGDSTLKIQDVSRHIQPILHMSPELDIREKDPMTLLFGQSSLNPETISMIHSTLITTIHEYEYQWDFNKQNLPTEMHLFAGEVIVELDWSIILFQDKVTKVLITMKDVTDLRQLKKQHLEIENNIQKLICLSLMEQRDYFIFIKSVKRLLGEAKQVIKEHQEFVRDAIDVSFRNLHTIKGLARSYDMKQLSNFIHEVEESFHSMRDQKMAYSQAKSLTLLEAIELEVESYVELARVKLKWDADHASVNLPVSELTQWYNDIALAQSEKQIADSKIDRLLKDIKRKYSSTFAEIFRDMAMNLQKLSSELNKGSITFTVKGGEVFVAKDSIDSINAIFVHLIRNSVDHGLQTSAERERLQLAEPEIVIELNRTAGGYQIIQSDNGRGLDLNTLASKARERNILFDPTQQLDIAQLIFKNGISTKTQVSDISGRGVGMDAVKSYLEQHQGSIHIQPKGAVRGGFLPFAFVIQLPEYFFES